MRHALTRVLVAMCRASRWVGHATYSMGPARVGSQQSTASEGGVGLSSIRRTGADPTLTAHVGAHGSRSVAVESFGGFGVTATRSGAHCCAPGLSPRPASTVVPARARPPPCGTRAVCGSRMRVGQSDIEAPEGGSVSRRSGQQAPQAGESWASLGVAWRRLARRTQTSLRRRARPRPECSRPRRGVALPRCPP